MIDTSEYIFDEVNKILENHKQKMAIDYKDHFSHLGQYVKDSLAPVMQQTAEIDEKNYKRWLEGEATAKARFEDSEKKRDIQIRVQNACILLATAIYNPSECIEHVMHFEKVFKGK